MMSKGPFPPNNVFNHGSAGDVWTFGGPHHRQLARLSTSVIVANSLASNLCSMTRMPLQMSLQAFLWFVNTTRQEKRARFLWGFPFETPRGVFFFSHTLIWVEVNKLSTARNRTAGSFWSMLPILGQPILGLPTIFDPGHLTDRRLRWRWTRHGSAPSSS